MLHENKKVNTVKPHISINVRDIDASFAFYKKLFGVEPVKFIKRSDKDSLEPGRPRGYAKFDVVNPPLNFTLNETGVNAGGSLSHLGIQVGSTEDVLAVRERWITEGLAVNDEMRVDCCYALQDKTWATDPDGNEWEVFVVLENTELAAADGGLLSQVGDEKVSAAGCCLEGGIANNISHLKSTCC